MVVQRKARITAYRAAINFSDDGGDLQQLARVLEWQLNQWDERQKKEWREAMELAFKTFYDSSPSLRQTIEEQKNGPPQIFLDRHKWQR